MKKENFTLESLPQAMYDLFIMVDELTEMVRILTPQQPTPAEDKLLTVEEAAKFLNLKVPTIYSKVSRGELPHSKVGKRLYFSHAELTAYIKTGKVLSNDEINQRANDYLSNYKKENNNGR
jgi:excisionase family DNA binding protein